MPIWEETPGQAQDTLERLYLSAGSECLIDPPGGQGGIGLGAKRPFPAQAVPPRDQDKRQETKHDETKYHD